MTTTTIPERGRMAELTLYVLRLGFLGFGGPVALGIVEMPTCRGASYLSRCSSAGR